MIGCLFIDWYSFASVGGHFWGALEIQPIREEIEKCCFLIGCFKFCKKIQSAANFSKENGTFLQNYQNLVNFKI
jgi:hypothetical protein